MNAPSDNGPPHELPDERHPSWGDRTDDDYEVRTARWRRGAMRVVVLSVLIGSAVIAGMRATSPRNQASTPTDVVLPGRFERHAGLLVAWPRGDASRVARQIVSATHDRLTPICVAHDAQQRSRVRETLEALGAVESARLVTMTAAEGWTGYFECDLVKVFDGTRRWVSGSTAEGRNVAQALASDWGDPVEPAPIDLAGASLLSNGAGLCVTTRKLIEANADRFDERQLRALLRQHYGAEQVVFLEPLAGDDAGDVHKIAAFVAADQVVVHEASRERDPVNHRILERNARALAGLETPSGLLKLMRIPMPAAHSSGALRTYTDVTFANGLLLFPDYAGVEPAVARRARAVYERALPGWTIVPVDMAPLVAQGRTLHSLTRHLYQLPP